MYDNGELVKENNPEAMKWYLKSANKGHILSQYYIGVMLEDGDDGVEANPKKSIEWIKKAADGGDAGAQNHLGYNYAYSVNVEENDELALKYYRLAVDQEYDDAQNNLGVIMYRMGNGVTQNYAEAMRLYLLAYEQGNELAAFNIGSLYESGESVKQNYKMAAEYYEQAVVLVHTQSLESFAHFMK